MREVLFKAKRVDNNEWVEGLIFPYHDGARIIEKSNINIHYEVHPETVCQFTGEVDKDGDKIFEGDICESSYYNTPLAYSNKKPSYTNLNQVVKFRVGAFVLKNMEEYDDFTRRMRSETYIDYIKSTLTIKVIGNIHD